MKASEFLKEFDGSHFPQELGPWISVYDHDPPFTLKQLKQMEKQGIIEFDGAKDGYHLTLKATKTRRNG